MPHAEESPVVNGEQPHSLFLEHLTSYPLVVDSISAYKSNHYGAVTISYADSGYVRIVKPLLPYAQQPYGLVAPYVIPYASRADAFAAHGLDRVDAAFPIITKDTATVKDTAMSYVLLPVRKADETKSYVLGTWGQEFKRCGGEGVVAASKAAVTTGLIVSADVLSAVQEFLAAKRTQGEAAVKEVKEKVQK